MYLDAGVGNVAEMRVRAFGRLVVKTEIDTAVIPREMIERVGAWWRGYFAGEDMGAMWPAPVDPRPAPSRPPATKRRRRRVVRRCTDGAVTGITLVRPPTTLG